MLLWNALLPAVLGVHTITFWQALGLMVLSRILVGGLGGHGNDRSKSSRPCAGRWERMTPEEREKFREHMRSGCGGFGAPTGGANEPA